MDHPQTPRVLQPHLSSFQHRIVRVLGKVVQLRGENAVVDAGGQIDVILNRVSISNPDRATASAELARHEWESWCSCWSCRLCMEEG
jgi:hypothetical protein